MPMNISGPVRVLFPRPVVAFDALRFLLAIVALVEPIPVDAVPVIIITQNRADCVIAP